MRYKFLILGAGPAGLSFANRLLNNGEKDFFVLEKESEVGGLCRSMDVDGGPLDIGGGHFLDVRRKQVTDFLFDFMPKNEWNLFTRDSRIQVGSYLVNHPLEANIWQFPENEMKEYLSSISEAGCNNGIPMPERFVDWIQWKLGRKISVDYMLPYNRKMFSDDLDQLGTYWLDKLPNVSYEDTLNSIEEHRAFGSQPGHAQFYYPKKYGYGELWKRMGERIGSHIATDSKVAVLDCERNVVVTSDGKEYEADIIVTTIPWSSFDSILGVDQSIVNNIKKLKSSSVEIRYQKGRLDTEAQWIYYPDEKLPYHRILVRHNFALECPGYWYETRKERTPLFTDTAEFSYLNEYAYPLNTIDKPQIMEMVMSAMKEKNIIPLGRWGEHSHYNSDVVVEKAMQLADEIKKR